MATLPSQPDSLEQVWADYKADPAIAELRFRRRFVPGVGNDDSPPAAFVGEAPGHQENEQGIPFVGRSGQLLVSQIERIGFTRSDVWITNAIKYQPRGNRTPTVAELKVSLPYLNRELLLVRPKVVVIVGGSTLRLVSPLPITEIHGRVFVKENGWTFYPVYHPAFVLRRRGVYLREFVEDFDRLARLMKGGE